MMQQNPLYACSAMVLKSYRAMRAASDSSRNWFSTRERAVRGSPISRHSQASSSRRRRSICSGFFATLKGVQRGARPCAAAESFPSSSRSCRVQVEQFSCVS